MKVHTITERVSAHNQNHSLAWSIFFKGYPAAMSNMAYAKPIVRQTGTDYKTWRISVKEVLEKSILFCAMVCHVIANVTW